ncbi:MAG: transketolase [Gaiellales bacterium]|nr:transketolase [Gaiellales bacterium]
MPAADIEKLSIDTIRCLAMDAVQKANAGHPGTAMALAPVAYVLYRERMRHDPADPSWPNRDRFVLSAGHACILQYAALHLSGYDLTIDDLEQFRQWGSRTPGHPELDREHPTPGVEITTGPLGQGVGNAVGMAVAEAMLAARFNRDGDPLVEHRTYAICSDGDVMEGVSGEASSLAGFLGLGKLCLVYDDNHITIEGSTGLAFGEDVGLRYEAYGFHVQKLDDGWSTDDLRAAFDAAEHDSRPSLIILRTHIAIGAPHAQDTPEAHGAPLGEEEVRLTKLAYGWDPDKTFYVPEEVYAHFSQRERGAALHSAWDAVHAAYLEADPERTKEFDRVLSGTLPEGWEDALPDLSNAEPQATRVSSGACIAALAGAIPEFIGGSADLAPSNNSTIKGAAAIEGAPLANKENALADSVLPGRWGGRTLHFGIREHGMGAILNGLVVHGGFRAFGATFFVFSDYMRPAVRLASIMGLPVIYVWTHDSIGLGEDGPTHQPIEHLASLRAMPRMRVIRPADATETVEAWRLALQRTDGPVGLALSRQKLPVLDRSVLAPASGVRRGGYVLADTPGVPDIILLASGSEVHDVLAARETLSGEGVAARVVSLPDWDLFMAQPQSYRDEVLPRDVWRRVSLEAGATFGWSALVGDRGTALGLDRYGASAPAPVIARELGITPGAVVAAAHALLAG